MLLLLKQILLKVWKHWKTVSKHTLFKSDLAQPLFNFPSKEPCQGMKKIMLVLFLLKMIIQHMLLPQFPPGGTINIPDVSVFVKYLLSFLIKWLSLFEVKRKYNIFIHNKLCKYY